VGETPSISTNIHASVVALGSQRGVLIKGASGTGKSLLALRLMAYGAQLVADDRVDLSVEGGQLIARAPPQIAGRIEAREVGLLQADPMPRARIILCANLDEIETERLPEQRKDRVLGVELPLVLRVQHGHLDVAILQWLKGGRWA
jgi:HPr kinase/phosphorylase